MGYFSRFRKWLTTPSNWVAPLSDEERERYAREHQLTATVRERLGERARNERFLSSQIGLLMKERPYRFVVAFDEKIIGIGTNFGVILKKLREEGYPITAEFAHRYIWAEGEECYRISRKVYAAQSF